MPLQFTTVEAIGRRLIGRYDLGMAPSYGHTLVPPELIEQLASQAEALLSSVLMARYVWPLQDMTYAVLAEFVELHTVCNLNPIQFSDNRAGGDVSDAQLVHHACTRADQLLKLLATGQLFLPGETLLESVTDQLPALYCRSEVATYVDEPIEW
jgi:phage gp36-like protein